MMIKGVYVQVCYCSTSYTAVRVPVGDGPGDSGGGSSLILGRGLQADLRA